MTVRVNIGGNLLEPTCAVNGAKHGDILAPTHFSFYFTIVFQLAFRSSSDGIYISYHTTGKIFNIRRLTAELKTYSTLVRDLYADDGDIVSHIEWDIQILMNAISVACEMLGLTINLTKTFVLFQPTLGMPYIETKNFVYGEKLTVVSKFVYLGSTLNTAVNLHEVPLHIQMVSFAFGKLEDHL